MFTTRPTRWPSSATTPTSSACSRAGTTASGRSRPYLVMRYCPPPTSAVRVPVKPMRSARRSRTGIKLASAIETAHRVRHHAPRHQAGQRPRHAYAEPALTDFGIAGRAARRGRRDDVAARCRGRRPSCSTASPTATVASDVYSLAATLWHLLVGRSPFAHPERRQLLACPDRPDPARVAPAHPACRRAARPRPAAPAVPGQGPGPPAAQRARAGAGAAAHRGAVGVPSHHDRRRVRSADRAGRGGPRRRGRHRAEPGHGRVGLEPSGRPSSRPPLPAAVAAPDRRRSLADDLASGRGRVLLAVGVCCS